MYEGDITVLDEGHSLQIDLKGYDGDKVVPLVARFEFEKDGTLRQRVWSVGANSERVIIFDVRYEKRKS